MATSTLAILANRLGGHVLLGKAVTGVAVDAPVAENFVLPTGFGDLYVDMVNASLSALSGAYVAPAPAFDGFNFGILSSDAATQQDYLGDARWTNVSTSSARPIFAATVDPNQRTIYRQGELLIVTAPIIAGAGVTATITVLMRGLRLRAP